MTPSHASDAISVISKQTKIDGDCVVGGRIRIEGHVAGNVCAGSLEVAASGTVDGDVTAGADAQGPFLIAGRVSGSVRSPRVEVASGGVVLEGVEGDDIQIQGRVQGGVVARNRLLLEKTAEVEGDVRARVLALDEGGQVNGTIVMGRAASEDSVGEEASSYGAGEPDVPLSMSARREGAMAQETGGEKADQTDDERAGTDAAAGTEKESAA